MKQCLSVVLIVLLWNISSSGQTFTDVSVPAGFSVLSQSEGWGNGVSFYDVDEDGWDDLTVCIAGQPTRFYRNELGLFVLHTFFFNDVETKSCLWVDLDEDGDNDLFVTRYNAPHQVFKNLGDLIFEDISFLYSNLYTPNQYAWGASFGDFNRDGFVDLSIANYGLDGMPNTLARGTGNGLFQPLVLPPVTSSSKTSFQPVWLDLNRDLLQDLYIINDHSFGNEYYVQENLGVFEDKSIVSGLNIPSSAMSNAWCDFDRDGDMDVYITNTIQGNRLMVNDGENFFSDQAVVEGVVLNAWTWSALWIDAENDGWDDMYIASKDLVNTYPQDNFYFKNNAGSFEAINSNGLSNQVNGGYASAKGDFNNDGKSDIVLNTESNSKYKLYKNDDSSNNNYLKFRLEGRLSNRNGIGTYYEYWFGGQRKVGYTYCGEGYLTQNSQNIILGLGDATLVDSLHLHWLSGVIDVHYNLTANTFLVFTEAETKPQIASSKQELCPSSDSAELSITDWPFVVWDNGSLSATRTITVPGSYAAEVSTGFGHSITLSKFIHESFPPDVLYTVIHPTCFGIPNGQIHAEWQTASDTLSIHNTNLGEGSYFFPIVFGEGCTAQLSAELQYPLPLNVEATSQPANCAGSYTGAIALNVSGGTQPYNFGEGSSLVISNLNANNYNGILFDTKGCEISWSASVEEPSPIIVTGIEQMPSVYNDGNIVLSVSGGIQPYDFQWSNGCVSMENLNLQAGDYLVSVTDSNGCAVDTSFSLIFNFVQPLNLNTMNWTLHKDGLHYDGSETLHHVFVYDAVGKLLHREQIMAGHTTIPMDAIGPLFILSHEGNWKSSISLE